MKAVTYGSGRRGNVEKRRNIINIDLGRSITRYYLNKIYIIGHQSKSESEYFSIKLLQSKSNSLIFFLASFHASSNN